MRETIKKELLNLTGSKIIFNEPLKKHTTYGVGGMASAFILPSDSKDLIKILKFINEKKINLSIMGSGSNLLVNDRGFDGAVISLKNSFKKFEISKTLEVNIGTGVMLGNMVRKLTQKSVIGLESLVGVPGTLGGAIIMNAGAYGSEISNNLVSVKVIDLKGNQKTYMKQDIDFDYRYSSFKKDELIIEAKFQFQKGNLDIINKNQSDASSKRKLNQPLTYKSAGSVFKNPNNGHAAGYLIDKSNLKGKRIGDAEISQKHANFIINHGNAKSNEIFELIKIIKNRVKTNFKVNLELEVKLLGFNSEELSELN